MKPLDCVEPAVLPGTRQPVGRARIRCLRSTSRICLVPILAGCVASTLAATAAPLTLRPSTAHTGQYERIEFQVDGLPPYAHPFDPAEVDLRLEINTPSGRTLALPAFQMQGYEHRRLPDGRDWFYPIGSPTWRARFAPIETGRHQVVAILTDHAGTRRSQAITFECTPSRRPGFVRVSRKDPRFLELSDGTPFFAIGQNLAFIGESQYVTLRKAEEIFSKLADNGANYLRVWTGCDDWALAIESRKSAWGRSWSWRPPFVSMPGDESRQCILVSSNHPALDIDPSHPVALRPATPYVLSGRIRTEPGVTLDLQILGSNAGDPLSSAQPLEWTEFHREFTTGPRDDWLGPARFRLHGNGSAWLSGLSLKAAWIPGSPGEVETRSASSPALRAPSPPPIAEERAGVRRSNPSTALLKESADNPELLWEAAIDRPVRGFYNPLDGFMLDELVAAAQQRGIYLQLCLSARNLYLDALQDPASPAYDRAIADAKNLLRYAVARWGYSTSVAAWEYWNEMNPNLPTDRCYAELGAYLEQIDPYAHVRTTSTWGPSAKDCRHPKLDLADAHFYLRPADKGRLADEVDAVLERTRWLREQAPLKPAHLGEFGLADNQWRITDEMKQHRELVDVHNALWASALSGASGTAMFWWWERLDERGVYPLYRPVSRFIADVPWNSGKVRLLVARCSDERIRVIGLRAGDRAWLWLFDPAASWAHVVSDGQPPPERTGLTLDLAGYPAGSCHVAWWDTRSGEVLRTETVEATTAPRLAVPAFRGDIACQVEP